MNVYINYNDSRWRKYKINFKKIAEQATLKVDKNAEVSIILTNDDEIQKINREYRNIDKPTNVLSFELKDDILLGDIYISLDTIVREAKQENISVNEHTAHMVVHGMLHLQGYDHIKDKDAEVMEKKETEILNKLGMKNPYAAESCTYSCPGGGFISWIKKIKPKEGGVAQYVIMALLGGIAALGFAPFYMWWATLIAVGAAYKLMINTKTDNIWRNFLYILPFSAAYSIAMFWWVTNSIYVVPELAKQFAVWTGPALLGIGLLGGIIFAIPFVVIKRICTFPSCRPFLFATTWTLVLWLREWLLTGFPWNPMANITMNMPFVANSMSFFGALGLTFVITGLIASVIEMFSEKQNKFSWVTLILFLCFGLIGIGYAYKNIQVANQTNNSTPVIRIIQPAQSASQKATHSKQEAIRKATENIHGLIELANAPGNPELVVFPETSYPFVIIDDDSMPVAEALNNNVIIGATSYSDGKLYNSMVVAKPNGEIQNVYSKSHLVPFGEYRPFGDIIPTPGQLSKGTGPEIINININGRNFKFAPAICYEIIFSDSLLPNGQIPDAIINITNDTWFGKTPGTYQHLDMVRRYAIESGQPIVRANYSGISAFISSDGSVISEIPVARPGYADGVVSGAHMTVYHLLGRDAWMVIILVLSCICTILLHTANKSSEKVK